MLGKKDWSERSWYWSDETVGSVKMLWFEGFRKDGEKTSAVKEVLGKVLAQS